ncbi:MAG: autotransporter-associated beta strand repeat-containing protein, partial [Prosthecobacter sp.]
MKTIRQYRQPLGWMMTCLMALWLPGPYARAALGTWIERDEGSFTWQDFTNWNLGVIPGSAMGDSATLSFDFLGGQLISLNDTLTLGTLNIGDTSGNTGIVLTSGVGGTISFNNGGTAVINKSGDGLVGILANIGLQNPTVINVAGGVLVLDGIVDGVNGFTKNGDGTLVLRRANTFTGPTVLNGGMTIISQLGNDLSAMGATNVYLNQGTVVNDGASLVINNDASNTAGDTTGGGNLNTEPLTITGQGFRNMGALRGMAGRESNSFTGTVTMLGASRVQSDYGTLTLSGSVITNDYDLRIGGAGFTSISGPVTGNSTITHYGINGFRLQSLNAAHTFSGAIVSELGEIRADVSDANTGLNPYANVSSFSIKNGYLNILAQNSNYAVQNRIDDDIAITLSTGRIRMESVTFNSSNAFNWSETLGTVTLTSGDALFDFRDSSTGTVQRQFTLGSLTRSAGTTIRMSGDGNASFELGKGTKYRIFNSALEGGGNVAFIGGWAYGYDTSTTQTGFLKYNDGTMGGNGYRTLEAGDYATDTADSGWSAAQNIKISGSNRNITMDRTIQSLNMAGTTARTLSGDAGTTLTVDSGGIITTGGTTHTISVPYLTAGASSGYELYLINTNSVVIRSEIANNGGNEVSLVKTGGGTLVNLSGNSYTGTTYINEGHFRDVIGSKLVALGSGNLTMAGSSINQSTYESDRDFTRALGSGVGEVQITGGTGTGFSAYGAPIEVNFGGIGGTLTWGSPFFNPGVFTLNGGSATHVATLAHDLDLAGEQRYIRVDGAAAGGNRAAIGVIEGDIFNGGIAKQGGGMLLIDSAKSYQGGTLIREGELWLRGDGTAGANVVGNDILIGAAARLKLDGPSNVGSNQMIIMQNGDDTNASAITFGAGYGTGEDISFNSLISNGGLPQTGPYSVMIANQQTVDNRRNRVAVQISGNSDFQADLPGLIKAVAPDVEVWFGADSGNGVFTGSTISATGRNKTGGTEAFRLGSGNGTLTIANANVLRGANPLIVGAEDQTARTNMFGTVYLQQAQNYTGTVTASINSVSYTAGNLVGGSGVLVVGQNGALNAANNTVWLRGGQLRLGVDSSNSYAGQTDLQYAARDLLVTSTTGTLRTIALGGGYFGTVELDNLTMRMDDADRIFSVNSIGTTYMNTVFNGTTVLDNGSTDRNAYFDIGNDNSFQSGIGLLTLNNVVSQTGAGVVNLRKRQGGVLILSADNTYLGETRIEQGRLVLNHVGAAGLAGSTIRMEMQNDRRGDLEFRMDGAGSSFVFDNDIITSGNDGGETRVITVGSFNGSSVGKVIQLDGDLTIGHGGTHAANGTGSSAIYFDHFDGYEFEVLGTTTLNRSITLRTRGGITTLSGVVAGGAANTLEKSEQGTLVLAGDNTYAGNTDIYNGYIVAAHDNAFGTATSAIRFMGSSFSEILASGVRTIDRDFNNAASGSTQTLGGLDAGAKVFSGDITLGRTLNLTAALGGDVTFSGTFSGGQGINKVGAGTVILNPTSGSGSSYSGGTTVTQGTLVGVAQTSGSPFGTGAFTLANGTLRLEGIGSATTTTGGVLTINSGNAAIVINDGMAGGTQMTFASLTRSNSATLTIQGLTTDIGTAGAEVLNFTSAPGLSNGTIGTWAVVQGMGGAGDYAGISGGNIVTATYGGIGDLDTVGGATQLFNAGATGGTLTTDRSVYAFRTDANVNLGGFTLNVGSGGQAGMILNAGADISNGTINMGGNTLAVFTESGSVSAISAGITNFRANTNNTLTTALTKFGEGTLELSGANSFQGNVQVNQGTLSLTAANVIPTFGNLNVVTGGTVTIQPGATVKLNGNNQEFGALAGNVVSSATRNIGGTLDLGGATLVLGRNNASTTFSGQIIGGAGSTITKVGTGRLSLYNYDPSIASTLDTLNISQGVVEILVDNGDWGVAGGTVSSLPSTTALQLRGGELEVRVFGDSTTNWQLIRMGNDVVTSGANSILDINRAGFGSGASNKIVTFGNLSLDKQRFLVTGGNANYPRFDGIVTLNANGRIQTDAPLLLNGAITGNFSLEKRGSSQLEIGADNSSWNGGVVATDGTILFGTRDPAESAFYQGSTNHFLYSATANLGTGDIVINRSTAIRLNAPTNVLSAQGQRVQTFGSLQNGLPRVDIGVDAPLTSYSIRSTGNGALNLGLNEGLFTQAIDQSKLGNGKWGLGAWTTTFYTADTMGAGVDNVYRFLGTNATLGITQDNVLSGSADLWVGAPQYDQGYALSNSSASVRLYGDQSYTGKTTIFRSDNTGNTNNFLELLGDSASPVYDVYGRLTARGSGRFTDDDGNQVNIVNLYPGSTLRLDYSMDVNDSFVVSRLNDSNLGFEAMENKWGDTTAMTLDGATLNMVSSYQRVNKETIGQISVKNGAAIYLERNSTNGQIVLETNSGINRIGQATFDVRINANELGRADQQGQKFFINDFTWIANNTTNGILPVWMINPTYNTFLSYNDDFGVQLAGFTKSATSGGGAAFLNSLTATDIADYGVGLGDASGFGTVNVYALRIAHQAASNDTTLDGGQINIHSGGLIVDNRDNARVNFNTTNVYFGDGSAPVEGVVFTDQNNQTLRIGGVVTADGFTMHGIGNVQLTNTANLISGNIQINGGKLYLDGAGTAGTASITLAGDWLQNNDGQQMAELRLRTNNATNQTWNNTVIVAENVPYARIIGEHYTGTSATVTTNTIAGLTVLGTDTLQGTALIIGSTSATANANTHNLSVSGATNFGGSSPIGLRVEQSSRVLELQGTVTGSADIIKSGDGVLRLNADNTATLTSRITLNRGEIRLQTTDSSGSGDYILNYGTIRLASSTANTPFFTTNGQTLYVNGQTYITLDRDGGAATNKFLGTDGGGQMIVADNSPLLIVNGSDTLFIEAGIQTSDILSIRTDITTYHRDVIQGAGRIVKIGNYLILDNNAANTFSGGYDAFNGHTIITQANGTLGTGRVRLFAGAGISTRAVSNLGTTGLTLVTTSNSALPVVGTRVIANFDAITAAVASVLQGNGHGILTIDNGQNLSADPQMATRDGGAFNKWFLGAGNGNGTLSIGSVTAWGEGSSEFRIGGGGGTLYLSPGSTTNPQFAGDNRMLLGSGMDLSAYGGVVINNNSNNTYTGGTLLARTRHYDGGYRGMILYLRAGENGTRTPLGTGAVDVFGDVRIENVRGTAAGSIAGTNANQWYLHPSTRLRFDNDTPYTGTNPDGRWGDSAAIFLNGGSLEIIGDTTNHAFNSETVGALTAALGADISVIRRSPSWAELVLADLTRDTGSSGTLTIRHNTNLLGVAGTANAERLIVTAWAGGSPLMNNGMVDPWIVSRSQQQFLRYDTTRGFEIITTGNTANYISTAAATLNASVLPLNNGT